MEFRCPICKKQFSEEETNCAPFCSKRCKLIDLGEWMSEGYKITVEKEKDTTARENEASDDES